MNPIIQDIMTKDIYYYDDKFKDICVKFCENEKITYLPSISEEKDSSKGKYCYEFKNKSFEKMPIEEDKYIIRKEDYIFNEEILKKFEKSEILFIFDKNELTGIMHFSDYNKSEVYGYLYKRLSEHEKQLRELLHMSGYKNNDMIEFFERRKAKNECYQKKHEKHSKKSEQFKGQDDFQCFFLSDLIAFLNSEKISVEDYTDIRNAVMHTKDIKYYNDEEGELACKFEVFKSFFSDIVKFEKYFKKVDNEINLKKYKKIIKRRVEAKAH